MRISDWSSDVCSSDLSARAKHAQWRHPRSDFLTLLKLWQQWRDWNETAKNRQLRKICRDHYVSFLRMEEWEAVHRQVRDLLGGERKTKTEANALSSEQRRVGKEGVSTCSSRGLP